MKSKFLRDSNVSARLVDDPYRPVDAIALVTLQRIGNRTGVIQRRKNSNPSAFAIRREIRVTLK